MPRFEGQKVGEVHRLRKVYTFQDVLGWIFALGVIFVVIKVVMAG